MTTTETPSNVVWGAKTITDDRPANPEIFFDAHRWQTKSRLGLLKVKLLLVIGYFDKCIHCLITVLFGNIPHNVCNPGRRVLEIFD